MKNALFVFTFLFSFCSLAQEAQKDVYSLEIPEELATDIEDHSYRSFGDFESFTFSIVTENDNLGHGIGAALGLKAISPFEGDDLGKSFAIDLNMLWKYENAELAISFFSNLYSRFGFKFNEHGVLSERNENSETYTENLGYEGVRAKLTKDVNEKVFLTFELEVAREDDKNTMAIFIQDFFHRATKSWDNAQGGKQVQYEYLDHLDPRLIATSTIGAGRRFTLYDSKKMKLKNATEVGHRFSTESNFEATYIKSSFDLERGRSKFSLYGEYDTKDNYVYGALIEREVYNSPKYKLSMSLGVSKEKLYYNEAFPDLYNHEVGSKSTPGGDLLYQYNLKLRFK